MELALNQPPLLLFSESLTNSGINIKEAEGTIFHEHGKSELVSDRNLEMTKSLKFNLFFEKKNSIIIRIFNIEEPSDSTVNNLQVNFSLSDFAENLYLKGNLNQRKNIRYEELTLSQQELISDMEKREINWNLGEDLYEKGNIGDNNTGRQSNYIYGI